MQQVICARIVCKQHVDGACGPIAVGSHPDLFSR